MSSLASSYLPQRPLRSRPRPPHQPSSPPPRRFSFAVLPTVPRTFPVVFGLRNYGVAPAGLQYPRTGHFHILINVEPPAPGVVIPADSLHRHYGAGQIETMLTLAPGTYTLRLVLADHEHRAIGPELTSRPVRIIVR